MANPSQSLLQVLSARQAALGLHDDDIARCAAFESAKIWSQIKVGRAKLPIQRIAGVARVLRLDEGELLELALADYLPEVLGAIQGSWGARALRGEERQVIEQMRKVMRGGNRVISVTINGEPLALPKE